jgi:hypothetical protein
LVCTHPSSEAGTRRISAVVKYTSNEKDKVSRLSRWYSWRFKWTSTYDSQVC